MTNQRSTVVAAAAGGLALVLACAACSAPGPAVYEVRSGYEVRTPHDVARDCGFSVPVSSVASLWLFCDTVVTNQHGQEVGYPILGTDTAAEGPFDPGHPPGDLSEVPTPGAPAAGDAGGPQPFLPAPAGITLPGSATLPCTGRGAYPARWITGAAAEPEQSQQPAPRQVLISFIDYCVSGVSAFTPEAFGLIGYDPADNFLRATATVFRAAAGQPLFARWQFGSPVFYRGWTYLFTAGRGAFLARVAANAAAWDDGYAYQYWTGRAWSSDPAAGTSVTGSAPALFISAGDYRSADAGLLIIEQLNTAGDFKVWQAAAPAGPWRPVLAARVPCTKGAQAGASGLCRAIIGHAELSRPGELFVSFFDPGADHVELAGYPIPAITASAPGRAG